MSSTVVMRLRYPSDTDLLCQQRFWQHVPNVIVTLDGLDTTAPASPDPGQLAAADAGSDAGPFVGQ
jgi:hypothetical protein